MLEHVYGLFRLWLDGMNIKMIMKVLLRADTVELVIWLVAQSFCPNDHETCELPSR